MKSLFSFGKHKKDDDIVAHETQTFAVIGMTGSGKSTFINTILSIAKGEDFNLLKPTIKIHGGSMSDTTDCHTYDVDFKAYSIKVIDTPGLFDTSGEETDRKHYTKIFDSLRNAINLRGIFIVINASDPRTDGPLRKVIGQLLSLTPNETRSGIKIILNQRAEEKPDLKNVIERIYGKSEPQLVKLNLSFWNKSDDKNLRSFQSRQFLLASSSIRSLLDPKLNFTNLSDGFRNVTTLIDELKKDAVSLREEIQCVSQCVNSIGDHFLVILKLEKGADHNFICVECERVCHKKCDAWFSCEMVSNGKCSVCPKKCREESHVYGYHEWAEKTVNASNMVKEAWDWSGSERPPNATPKDDKIKLIEKFSNDLNEVIERAKRIRTICEDIDIRTIFSEVMEHSYIEIDRIIDNDFKSDMLALMVKSIEGLPVVSS